MKIARTMGFLAVMAVILPITARADLTTFTWGGASCGSCYGATYNLTFEGNATTDSTFKVTLTITTPSSGSVVSGQFLSGVGFGTGKNILAATLVNAPTGGGVTWNTTFDNINSTEDCSGAAPGKKVCSQPSNLPNFTLAQANGSSYSWTWMVTFVSPGLNTNLADIHIQAQYQTSGGSTGHIVSEDATAAPEPATVATLGMGLLLIAFKLRRRK